MYSVNVAVDLDVSGLDASRVALKVTRRASPPLCRPSPLSGNIRSDVSTNSSIWGRLDDNSLDQLSSELLLLMCISTEFLLPPRASNLISPHRSSCVPWLRCTILRIFHRGLALTVRPICRRSLQFDPAGAFGDVVESPRRTMYPALVAASA